MPFDAVALAGGGNRCYWQQGVLEAVSERRPLAPALTVGVSAGAFQACVWHAGLGAQMRDFVIPSLRARTRNIEWERLRQGKNPLVVGELYESLMRSVFSAEVVARLAAGPDLLVMVARPPRMLPGILAAAVGIGAYQVDRAIRGEVHPRFGHAIGFRSEAVPVAAVDSPDALVNLLLVSASVPPFMPVLRLDGAPAFDGGLVDNVPVDPLGPVEAAGGRTLVLLTRRYARLPEIAGRTYLQPSQDIPVVKFDVTNGDGIQAAYDLGLADGAAFAARL